MLDIHQNIPSEDIGCSYELTIDIKTNHSNILQFLCYSDEHLLNTVTLNVPATDSFQKYTITKIIPEECNLIMLRLKSTYEDNNLIYADNFQLKIQ